MDKATLIVGTTWGVLALCFIAVVWLTTFTLKTLDKRRRQRELEEAEGAVAGHSLDSLDAEGDAAMDGDGLVSPETAEHESKDTGYSTRDHLSS